MTQSGLTEPELSLNILSITSKTGYVVDYIEPASSRLISHHFKWFEPGEVVDKFMQVNSKVEVYGWNWAISQPPCLRLWFIALGVRTHETLLRHLCLKMQDISKETFTDHPAQLTHHGITGIVVNHGQEPTLLIAQCLDFTGLSTTKGQRLFADDWHSCAK